MTTGLIAAPVFHSIVRNLPDTFDGRARNPPGWAVLWVLSALMAVFQTTRLSIFMVEPGQLIHSMIPGSEWFERHSCISGYVHGARAAHQINVYDVKYGAGNPFTAPLPPQMADIAPFALDPYLYPRHFS